MSLRKEKGGGTIWLSSISYSMNLKQRADKQPIKMTNASCALRHPTHFCQPTDCSCQNKSSICSLDTRTVTEKTIGYPASRLVWICFVAYREPTNISWTPATADRPTLLIRGNEYIKQNKNPESIVDVDRTE